MHTSSLPNGMKCLGAIAACVFSLSASAQSTSQSALTTQTTAATPDPAPSASSGAGSFFSWLDSKPISETWINAGFESYHWQRDKGLNGDNYGFGVEYRFSTVASVTAGDFYNSDRDHSQYAGVYYQPIGIGPTRFGVVVGGFNGYPKMKNGGWFPAAIPVLSYEYERVGLNLAFVPSYKDRLYGALSFQFKLKVF